MYPNAQHRIDCKLSEGKQVGLLYHWTTMDGCNGILSSNAFHGGRDAYTAGALSFTRDKDPNFWQGGKHVWRFTMDGDRISDRFKIGPYADWLLLFTRSRGRSESEEQVMLPPGKKLAPLSRYVFNLEWHGGGMDLDGAQEIVDAVNELGGDTNKAQREYGWAPLFIDQAYSVIECLRLAEMRGIEVEDRH